ncbi:MAG: peptidoglycan DD-metalloendopeptidase family protein [Actinomycetia bacterium]|nr:peptidoglycan DD-metalloendopeptidase family protein [Actinomycetes bacterium]
MRIARPAAWSVRLAAVAAAAALAVAVPSAAALAPSAPAPAGTRPAAAAADVLVDDLVPAERDKAAVARAAAAAAASRAARREGFGYGSRGSGVRAVQSHLGVPVTGFFGPATLAAVRAFQRRADLPVTGVVSVATYQRILRVPIPRPRPAAPVPAARVSAAGLACPAPGARFSDDFGDARSGGRSHQGIDMVGRRGAPLLAIESGVVVRARSSSLGGLSIVLQGRSGAKYFYTHNDSNLVRAGQRVSAGQTIGRMGDSGNARGTVHLHFEWWRSGGESAAVNPYRLLRSVC